MSLEKYSTEGLRDELALRERYKLLSGQANPREILREVSRDTGYSAAALVGPRRTRNLARARWLAFERLRKAGLSYPDIGLVMGRHHTTVIAGLRRLEEERRARP